MGKPLVSSKADLARDEHNFGNNSTKSLFSRSPGSAWSEALRAAELLLLESPSAELKACHDYADLHHVSLEELITELEAAERDSKPSAEWDEVLSALQCRTDGITDAQFEQKDGLGRRDRMSTDSQVSKASQQMILERSARWGYGLALKNSSRGSTPRTSSGSSSASGRYSHIVPGVSKDVRDALSSFRLAFMVCDATHPDYPILYASAGFSTMTGYSADEAVGRNCRYLQGVNTDAAEVARIRDALNNGRTYTGTLLNYKKDGTPFWNLLTISPIKDDTGRNIKYIGMQAEQKSKDCPRRVEGQTKGFGNPGLEPLDKPKSVGVPGNRRPPRNLSVKVPVAPQKASAESCADLDGEQQQQRGGARYSLTTSSTRNSLEDRDADWQAILRLRASHVNVGLESTSSVEAPEITARRESTETRNSSRRKSKFFRLFRKDAKDPKSENTVPWKADDYEDSDRDDERTMSSISARRSGISKTRTMPATSMEDKLNRSNGRVSGREYTPSLADNKEQFCIVHT